MPLSLHIATNRPSSGVVLEDNRSTRPGLLANADHWVRVSLAHLIFTGVFERYPTLRIGSVEHELSWAPHFLERLELPSNFFHSNVFLSFQEDALGIRDRALIGVDALMWGSDYPHTEATFPRSREVLDTILAGVSDQERQQITSTNIARLYHFDLP
jgi:predicted TIM-barrel fold metal-dependent hydrolase